jgi:diamine N-acetyltransferase
MQHGLITLRKIDQNNWKECLRLKLRREQVGIVGPNVLSLAEAFARPEANCLGVYDNEDMVGFMMYLREPEDEYYYIHRFMIDGRCQNRGIGRRALELTVDRIKMNADCKDRIFVFILVHPHAAATEQFYRSAGFIDTKEIVFDGESMKRFYLPIVKS